LKKLVFSAILLFGGSVLFAQKTTSFGVTAGYTNISENVKANDGSNSFTVSDGESGFYVGGLMDIAVGDNFHVQPEALFALVQDTKFLYIPVLAKFYIADSGFHVLAGPQANIVLEETFGTNAFGLDLTFGAGYDINEHFFLDARYGLELTNRVNDAPNDAKVRYNTLNVGVGYRF